MYYNDKYYPINGTYNEQAEPCSTYECTIMIIVHDVNGTRYYKFVVLLK